MLNRRQFFSKSALTAGALATFPNIGKTAHAIRDGLNQKPASIIHLVADGLSAGTLTCADYLSKLLREKGLSWVELMKNPSARMGLMNMRSLDSMVTDSAAASSSWGSGSRVANGSINQLPSGKPLTPLYTLLAQQGWKRGLVTTTEITHATPAGFATRTADRNDADSIAEQYLKSEIDVLLGGGSKFFSAASRNDAHDLRQDFIKAGYQVMDSAPALALASVERRWLGTFAPSHLPFCIDQAYDAELQHRVPHLKEMTRRALEWMGRHDHFVLQVEGGRVDHGAHNCDAPATLREVIAFDEALDVVLEFQARRPDTLVIITTDHGNGNMGANGSGSRYEHSSALFGQTARVKASFPEILRRLHRVSAEQSASGGAGSTLQVTELKETREILSTCLACNVSEEHAALFQSFLAHKGSCLYQEMNSQTAQLGQLLANYTAIGWTSGAHTADYVPITAIGPGSERFAGFIQNTDLFRQYTQFAGIDFHNPEESLIASGRPQLHTWERVSDYAIV